MQRKHQIAGLLLIGLLGTSLAVAQDTTAPTGPAPQAPVPPLYQPPTGADEARPAAGEVIVPDQRPLSGAQLLTLGSSSEAQNVLTPSLHFSQIFDSHVLVPGSQSYGMESTTFFGGGVTLDHQTARHDLSLSYTGGMVRYSIQSPQNSMYQQLGVAESIRLRRWTLLFTDDLSYSPEAPLNGSSGSFAGAGGNLVGLGFGILSGTDPNLLPNQSIYTLRSPRTSNTVLGQVEYNLSARTSWTASASYGILRFSSADFYSSDQLTLRTGVTHAFGAKDVLAVTFEAGNLSYVSNPDQIRTYTIQGSYARRLTGRLSWQIAGGPQIYTQKLAGLSSTSVAPSGMSSLIYSRGRNTFSTGATVGITNGSGVLIGARTYSVQGTYAHQWTRNWSTSLTGGYSRNDPIQMVAINSGFDTEYGTIQVSRRIGREIQAYASYTGQRQTGGSAANPAYNNFTRHLIGFGFTWDFRPIHLGR